MIDDQELLFLIGVSPEESGLRPGYEERIRDRYHRRGARTTSKSTKTERGCFRDTEYPERSGSPVDSAAAQGVFSFLETSTVSKVGGEPVSELCKGNREVATCVVVEATAS